MSDKFIKEEFINDKSIKNESINDMCEAPTLKEGKIYYNCSECSSPIEIIFIDEENIEFKCISNHHQKMKIGEYLNKMKKYNSQLINGQICEKHNKLYSSYCFECNIHLCQECLTSFEHTYHYKVNIIELKINSNILNEINTSFKI